jgi:class 3 adenylate cyclase
MKREFTSSIPIIMTVVAICIFVFTSIFFIIFNYKVKRRQRSVRHTASKTNTIPSSLFLSDNNDVMTKEEAEEVKSKIGIVSSNVLDVASSDDIHGTNILPTNPIADIYPETTVLLADIAHFTAWSLLRTPSQVFTLLETLFDVMDTIATRRKVFKVETIGDCYVAAMGLPELDQNHALIMAKFAKDILYEAVNVMILLETMLGPGTSDLTLRIGIHSGLTVAGVLKSRFQLFGDTVNTATHMKSYGSPGRIHISQQTADFLIAAGKGVWITQREDNIDATEFCDTKTYWLDPREDSIISQYNNSLVGTNANDLENRGEDEYLNAAKLVRLVDWSVNILQRLLHSIAKNRSPPNDGGEEINRPHNNPGLTPVTNRKDVHLYSVTANVKDTQLVGDADIQIKRLISTIAHVYQTNPYHNFEKACHMAMSTLKLINQMESSNETIVESDKSIDDNNIASSDGKLEGGASSQLYFDPITQFAIVFVTLIHDIDHSKFPDSQLVETGTFFDKKAVDEYYTFDIAWHILMQPEYKDLQQCIFTNKSEMEQFRQLAMNAASATAIFDFDKKCLRNLSWENEFNNIFVSETPLEETDDLPVQDQTRIHASSHLKAKLAIEYVIQVSYIAHTMQHWMTYKKWSLRHFKEMYIVYKSGHGNKDPSEEWYENELQCFESYVKPLAAKLKIGGVFGVSYDEFFHYACKNQLEWEEKGHDIVNEFVDRAEQYWRNRSDLSLPEAGERR